MWLGNDLIEGSAGQDTLLGGKGADPLHGSFGLDLLTGVGRSYMFEFGSLAQAGDTISDLRAGSGGDILSSRICWAKSAMAERMRSPMVSWRSSNLAQARSSRSMQTASAPAAR
ncbi:MAG TPA: calcium-binding protein [Nitrospiraceae bacterium]|nr:calcium-binding protein [Nitrospiraceae bacterium]